MQKMPKLMLDQDGTTYNVYCHYTHLSAPEQKESAANAIFGVIKATDPAKYLMRGEDFGKAADSALLKSKWSSRVFWEVSWWFSIVNGVGCLNLRSPGSWDFYLGANPKNELLRKAVWANFLVWILGCLKSAKCYLVWVINSWNPGSCAFLCTLFKALPAEYFSAPFFMALESNNWTSLITAILDEACKKL